MKDYGLADYGERIAEVYDDWMRAIDPADAVEALARLAGEGPVLELGIGTGRIALPLAERGLEVHGIDASEAMLATLREKAGGARIPTTVGDLADVAVADRYSLVFVAANTFFGVLSQLDQVRCFENVEAHLLEGGVFVIEAFVPDPARFDPGHLSVRAVELDSVRIEASRHDRASQTIDGQAIELRERGARFFPFRIRYAWPAELDLMGLLPACASVSAGAAGAASRSRRRAGSTCPYTSAVRSLAAALRPKHRSRAFARELCPAVERAASPPASPQPRVGSFRAYAFPLARLVAAVSRSPASVTKPSRPSRRLRRLHIGRRCRLVLNSRRGGPRSGDIGRSRGDRTTERKPSLGRARGLARLEVVPDPRLA